MLVKKQYVKMVQEELKNDLRAALEAAKTEIGSTIVISPVKVDLGRGPEKVEFITALSDNFYNDDTLHNLARISDANEIRQLTKAVLEATEKAKEAKSEEKDPLTEKWEEVLDFATQHATGKGSRTGILWLKDSFNEYLELSDHTPGYGMGGQPGCLHNRQVLAEKILLELGAHVGGRHLIDEGQEAKLRHTLNEIVADQCRTNGLKL